MPTDVDMTSSGEYIFADGYGNRAVHIFNADGTYRKTFGGVGDWEKPYEDTPGDMLIVHALCVDARTISGSVTEKRMLCMYLIQTAM